MPWACGVVIWKDRVPSRDSPEQERFAPADNLGGDPSSPQRASPVRRLLFSEPLSDRDIGGKGIRTGGESRRGAGCRSARAMQQHSLIRAHPSHDREGVGQHGLGALPSSARCARMSIVTPWGTVRQLRAYSLTFSCYGPHLHGDAPYSVGSEGSGGRASVCRPRAGRAHSHVDSRRSDRGTVVDPASQRTSCAAPLPHGRGSDWPGAILVHLVLPPHSLTVVARIGQAPSWSISCCRPAGLPPGSLSDGRGSENRACVLSPPDRRPGVRRSVASRLCR